jgi:hypothetical protein
MYFFEPPVSMVQPKNNFLVTNDTGYGDELTGTTGTHRHRDREDLPPLCAPPAVPNAAMPQTNLVANHLPIAHTQAIGKILLVLKGNYMLILAWGRMARWEKKERIGDVVTLIGQFVAVGRLAGTVHDGQDVKCDWDLRNQVSFALMRLTESEYYEDFWLYNRFVHICLYIMPRRAKNRKGMAK